jgi:hypothetical protein
MQSQLGRLELFNKSFQFQNILEPDSSFVESNDQPFMQIPVCGRLGPRKRQAGNQWPIAGEFPSAYHQ